MQSLLQEFAFEESKDFSISWVRSKPSKQPAESGERTASITSRAEPGLTAKILRFTCRNSLFVKVQHEAPIVQ